MSDQSIQRETWRWWEVNPSQLHPNHHLHPVTLSLTIFRACHGLTVRLGSSCLLQTSPYSTAPWDQFCGEALAGQSPPGIHPFLFLLTPLTHYSHSLAPNTQRWRWEPSCPDPGKDMKMLFLLTLREMEVLLKTARHEPELLKEWAGALLRLNLYARRQRHRQEPTPCTPPLSLSYRGRSRVQRTCPVTQSENKDWHQSCSDPGLTNLKAKLWKPILWPWAHMAALTHGAITGVRLSNSVQPASIFLTDMFICFGFLHLPHYSTNSNRLVCISNIVLGTL